MFFQKRWSICYHCSHSLLNLKEAAIWNLFQYLTSVTLLLNSDLQNNLTSSFLCKSEKASWENKRYNVIHNVLLLALKHNTICYKNNNNKKTIKKESIKILFEEIFKPKDALHLWKIRIESIVFQMKIKKGWVIQLFILRTSSLAFLFLKKLIWRIFPS